MRGGDHSQRRGGVGQLVANGRVYMRLERAKRLAIIKALATWVHSPRSCYTGRVR